MSSGQRLDWVTITRLLLGPDMALGLEASQATKACGSCGSHLAPDANFCRKCLGFKMFQGRNLLGSESVQYMR